MCAILILALLLVVVLIGFLIFVKTAVILLPWSLSAAALAMLTGVLVGRFVLQSAKPQFAMPVSIAATFVLTLALGYSACSLVPPKVPPAAPPKHDLRDAFDLPRPSQEKLEQHIPTHLAIAALLSAAAVTLFWPAVVRRNDDLATSATPDP